MNVGRLKTYIGSTLALFVFWLLITWTFHYQSVIGGLVVCILVVAFCRDIMIFGEERPRVTLLNFFRLIKYIASLIISMIEANIDVAKIVLSPKMPISPTFIEFKTNLKYDLTKVVFANSITLTPGTLTVELEDDVYLVHGLTRKHAEGVIDWHMALKLMEMEEG